MAEPVIIQGHAAGSQNEINVADALDELEMDYHYQYQIGLPGIRGSQTIDFLVYTVPKPTPLFVHGRYWHTGRMGKKAEDELNAHELMTMTRNRWAEPVIIWDDECETVEDAVTAVRKVLML